MKKLILCILFLNGCSSLTSYERDIITELTYTGVTLPREYVANPVTAGALNILPGFGNFYLGVGNHAEPSYIVVGVINLVLWPISILWGVPEAYIDAQTINQRATAAYYLHSPKGKKRT